MWASSRGINLDNNKKTRKKRTKCKKAKKSERKNINKRRRQIESENNEQ
jgi:hypothetical protein